MNKNPDDCADTPRQKGQIEPPRNGCESGFEELLPLVYEQLYEVASSILRHNRVVTSTCTSSLINDVYVRLAGRGLRFRDQSHFLALAARAMRMVLVDRVRRDRAEKRGGQESFVVTTDEIAPATNAPDLMAVNEALKKLAQFDELKSQIIELRFFGGLSIEETAQVTNLSTATVTREWTLARTWLMREIGEYPKPDN